MNNIFRILLLGALPWQPFPLSRRQRRNRISRHYFQPNVPRSSPEKPGIFCAGNWEPQTLTRIKSGPWHTPRKSPCYATCTNFSAPRKTENRSRSMNSRTSHSGNGSPPTRKSSECLPYPGQPANKPYPYFTASGTRTIKRSAPLKPAWLWGQGLPQMSSLLKNACPNSIFTGNPTSNPHVIPRRTRCSRGNGPSFSVAERAWKTCPGPSSS